MKIDSLRRYLVVALPFAGSAILLFSCEAPKPVEVAESHEALMTEYSENLSITQSENGRKSYHFQTPLMEGYAMAHDPYREFRKGIRITMFEDDSLSTVSATLTANYAIFYEDRKLWEAKGDVVAVNKDGRRLYTSQLFWNQATHRVYSNVDSKIVSTDEVYHCEGFESDEKMKDWTYRKLKGVTYVNDSEFGGESSSDDGAKNSAEVNQKAPESAPKVELKPLQRPRERAAALRNEGPVKQQSESKGKEKLSLELPDKR